MTYAGSATKKADRHWLFYVLIWLVFGFIVLISASAPVGFQRFNDIYFLLNGSFFGRVARAGALFIISPRGL